MAGCTRPPPDAQPQLRSMLLTTPDAAAPPPNDWSVNVALAAIPGAMLGSPVAASRFLIPASFGERFSVSLAALEQDLEPHAAPATPALLAGGLLVAPGDTRFLRVSTFVYDTKSGREVMSGGFIDKDGGYLMLAYFDRACTVGGVEKYPGGEMEMRLQIPAAGLYWMHAEQLPSNNWRMRLARRDIAVDFIGMPAAQAQVGKAEE